VLRRQPQIGSMEGPLREYSFDVPCVSSLGLGLTHSRFCQGDFSIWCHVGKSDELPQLIAFAHSRVLIQSVIHRASWLTNGRVSLCVFRRLE
jgi:hypothetical protein